MDENDPEANFEEYNTLGGGGEPNTVVPPNSESTKIITKSLPPDSSTTKRNDEDNEIASAIAICATVDITIRILP